MTHPADITTSELLYRHEMAARKLRGESVGEEVRNDETLAAELDSYSGMEFDISARHKEWERRLYKRYGHIKQRETGHKWPARWRRVILITVLILAMLAFIAAAVWYTVMRITYHDDHADIDLSAGSVVEILEFEFSPPDGFTPVTADSDNNINPVQGNAVYKYENDTGGFIDIFVAGGYNQQGIDTENADTEKISIGGSEAFISEKNDCTTLIAYHLDHTIKIFTNLSRDETIRLIETATIKNEGADSS